MLRFSIQGLDLIELRQTLMIWKRVCLGLRNFRLAELAGSAEWASPAERTLLAGHAGPAELASLTEWASQTERAGLAGQAKWAEKAGLLSVA